MVMEKVVRLCARSRVGAARARPRRVIVTNILQAQ